MNFALQLSKNMIYTYLYNVCNIHIQPGSSSTVRNLDGRLDIIHTCAVMHVHQLWIVKVTHVIFLQ